MVRTEELHTLRHTQTHTHTHTTHHTPHTTHHTHTHTHTHTQINYYMPRVHTALLGLTTEQCKDIQFIEKVSNFLKICSHFKSLYFEKKSQLSNYFKE